MRKLRLLIIVTGGIAAYKIPALVRLLRSAGHECQLVLTEAARQFVTPLTLAAVSGQPVQENLFDASAEAEIGHIQLSRNADLVLVAPATANIMAKMAHGLADDLASTLLLATDKPVLIAPAMNVRMWHHPATQRNLVRLKADGITLIPPEDGPMACGEYGTGRMAEPEQIAAFITKFAEGLHPALPGQRLLGGPETLTASNSLAGRHMLVTAGPTHEPIDPVRYIANRSSGKQGFAIAESLARAGAQVTLVSGPTQHPPPSHPAIRLITITTAQEMLESCLAALPADAAICAAAVADWSVAPAPQKIKKQADASPPSLQLRENPDILQNLAKHVSQRPRLVIGFAAETENTLEAAQQKRLRKGCDWILANDVSPERAIFGGDQNEIHWISAQGQQAWPKMSKKAVADRLTAEIASFFQVP